MPNIRFERFDNLFNFLTKSKIKAGEGLAKGKYRFFKSGRDQSKFINNAIFQGESLIIGDGGNANINYYNGEFSTSDHCYVAQKKDNNINVQYVYYYLKSNIKILENGFKGAGLKNISKKYISNIKIPVFDTEEQRKIVTQLSQIDQLIEKREDSIKLLDELLRSTFLDMFLNNSTKTTYPLGNYINFITSGSRGWAKYYSDKGALFLRIQNVNNATLLLDDLIRVNLPNKAEGKRTRVQENDLIMSITADLGRTAVIPKGFEEAYINQHLALLRLNLEKINPIFLSHYFCTDFAKLQIEKYNKGGAKAGLNFSDIKKVRILLPEKDLQDKFSKIAIKIENIKRIYQNSLDEINYLFSSISQKAFTGELNLNVVNLEFEDKFSDILDEIVKEDKTLHLEEKNKKTITEKVLEVEVVKEKKTDESKKKENSLLNKLLNIGLIIGGTALTAYTAKKIFDNYNKDVEDDTVKNGKDIIDFTNNIIEYEKDVSLKFNDRFLKNFIKVFQEKEVVLNNRLLEELYKVEFEKKPTFSDIKDTLVNLLERKEVEQFKHKYETTNGFEENIAFRIKE